MRAPAALAAASVSLALVLAAFAPFRSAPPLRSAAEPSPARLLEIRRIRAHFDSVLAELPARDLASLSAGQRARRTTMLATLRDYRDRGDFPHNYDFPGHAVPYFVDRETGTLCAVAHLLAASGRRDIVDRVARANNNVHVAELAGDSAFTNWLNAAGLTLAEAARIQVPYMIGDDPEPTASPERRAAYTAGSAVTIGSAVAASLWNARANAGGPRRVGTVLGMTAGAAALGFGAASLGDRGTSPTLGVANAAAGAVSLWLSTRGAVRHHRVAARQAAERKAVARAAVAPIVPVGGASGAGVAVTVRF